MSLIQVSNQALFDLSDFQHVELFKDCQYVWEILRKIKSYIQSFSKLGNIQGIVDPGAHIIHPESIFIGNGTIIEPGAFIQAPCIIGENCHIRHSAYIRGNVIIGNSCVIGSELKNCILMNHANAPHFNYVGDSLLGNYVNLGAGVKCANLRLDRKEVYIHNNGNKIPTGLKKFGAILGDYTQIGCNTVILPGTITGKEVICYPNVSFGGVISEKSIIRHSG